MKQMIFVKKLLFVLVILCVLFLTVLGCSKDNDLISLPPTPVLTASSSFAVIVTPYSQVRDTPFENSITVRHLRKGDIEAVYGRKIIVNKNAASRTMWIKLSDGWISETAVHIYPFRSQAETASEVLQK